LNRVTLIRHGETEWSRSGQHTGTTDIPLTEQGRALATKLEAALRGKAYAIVLTSPLSRARDTAAIAGFGDAVVDDDLREWDYGEYEGLTTPQIRERRPGWFLWEDGVPGGETIEAVAARVDRVIRLTQDADGDALLFAHGHLLRILAARWLGQPPGFGRHLVLSPATVSVLGWEREEPAIEVWNSPVP
jgi:probable phosphoglycerate mutase